MSDSSMKQFENGGEAQVATICTKKQWQSSEIGTLVVVVRVFCDGRG